MIGKSSSTRPVISHPQRFDCKKIPYAYEINCLPIIFNMLNELCKLSELDDKQEYEERGEKEEGVDPEKTRHLQITIL
jgi:hypothetical protein